ncbi:hypothetical protein M6B38_153245 [Iris pallida]|uniref:Uncharacterized protein n=1 Tax=Iris pallida TaxID=29817 RepID=A0AAX6F5B1_IRIPA|nr:hypothetical protein M6B38_181760 [Iris pallida]KAJ6811554.1 hypothetical protein M6B38_153245 [Iris pallida]
MANSSFAVPNYWDQPSGDMEAMCGTYYGHEYADVVEPAGVALDLEADEA